MNDAAVGSTAWQNPTNAGASDDSYATISCSGSGCSATSNYLKATNWGANIPTGSTIEGIMVIVEGVDGSYLGSGKDAVATVDANGNIGTVIIIDKLPGVEAEVSYGNLTFLWDDSWTAENINDIDFGMALNLTISAGPGGAATAFVDNIKITINYTEEEEAPAYVADSSDYVTLTLDEDPAYVANDSSYVVLTLYIPVSIPVSDTCTYGGSGIWEVDCSDYCNITTDVNMGTETIVLAGTGSFTVLANITADVLAKVPTCILNNPSGDGNELRIT